jgi:hypothetical protein
MNIIQINHYKNIFSYQENLEIYKLILKRNFCHGEKDRSDTPACGMTSELKLTEPLTNLLQDKVLNIQLDTTNLIRAYVNLFNPLDRPFFHTDGDVTTYLFYFCPKLNLDEGGETQFYIDGEVRGILPSPGSLVRFDGRISHRATSFRTMPRITVAFKYKIK